MLYLFLCTSHVCSATLAAPLSPCLLCASVFCLCCAFVCSATMLLWCVVCSRAHRGVLCVAPKFAGHHARCAIPRPQSRFCGRGQPAGHQLGRAVRRRLSPERARGHTVTTYCTSEPRLRAHHRWLSRPRSNGSSSTALALSALPRSTWTTGPRAGSTRRRLDLMVCSRDTNSGGPGGPPGPLGLTII